MLDSEPEVRRKCFLRQDRQRLALQGGQLVHVIVERRELSAPGIAQDLVEPALLGLAGKERDAERLRIAHILRHLRQHGDAARDVKAADADRQSGGEERPGEIDGAGKLIRLHPDQANQRFAAGLANHSDDPVRPDAPIGFVVGMQVDLDVRPEHFPAARVLGQAVQTCQRVGRNG